MKNAISPIGMILTLVVMVIVLLLVAQAWTKVAPTAVQVTSPSMSELLQDDADATEGEEGEEPQRLPTLKEMKESADQHAEELEEARKKIDQ